jgi:hypothetical protein
MNESSSEQANQYCELASAIVQKQGDVIGLDLAVKKAQKIAGLIVADDGRVIRLDHQPVEELGRLVDEYAQLSGATAIKFSRQAIEPLLSSFPNISLPKQLKESYSPAEEFLRSF